MKQLSRGAILVRAREILNATIQRCPEHTDILQGVRFVVSGRMTSCAGRAEYFSSTVKLSLPFFADEGNVEKHLFECVTHEVAHLVVGEAGRNGQPHGPQWKRVHRKMGGKGERCHSLTLADGFTKRKRTSRVSVECPKCGQPMTLGPRQLTKHRRLVARGSRGYAHGKCFR